MQSWQMQEAETRLPALVKLAELDWPQDITLHGLSVAVVLSRKAVERLTGSRRSVLDFMQSSPLVGLDDELMFVRDKGPTRDFAL